MFFGELIRHYTETSHPDPTNGGDPYFEENYDTRMIFGCPTLEAIDFWFSKEYVALKRGGFSISVFKINKEKVLFTKDGIQLAFFRRDAKLIERIPLPVC